MRFSLLTLIGITTLAALACAALAKPSVDWLSIIVTLSALTWTVQVLRAILLDGAPRAAATGWLLFATTYLALIFGPWTQERVGPALATSQAIQYAQAKWQSEQRINVNDVSLSFVQAAAVQPVFPYPLTISVDSTISYTAVRNAFSFWSSSSDSVSKAGLFHLTGHWLCAWLAGWLGALLATTFHRRAAAELALR